MRSNNIQAVKNSWKLHLAVMIVALQQDGGAGGENRANSDIIIRSLHEMALALGGAGYLYSSQFIFMLLSLLALHSARATAEAGALVGQQMPNPLAVLNQSLRLVLCERFAQELADEQLAVSAGAGAGSGALPRPSSVAGGSVRTPLPSAPHSRATPIASHAHSLTPPTGAGAPQDTFDIELLYAL